MDAIVITYNNQNSLDKTIRILKRYSFNIILVHHGLFPVEKYNLENVIRMNKDDGYAVCVNRGVQQAQGGWVLVMNDDVFLEGDKWLTIEERLNNLEGYEFAGFHLFYPDKTFQYSVGKTPPYVSDIFREESRIMSFIGILTGKKEKYRYRGPYYAPWLHNISGEIGHVIGALFAIKRDVFLKMGGMDKNYRLFYEESDLWMKYYKIGYKGYYFNDIIAYHIGGASFNRDKKIFMKESLLRYVRKWFSNSNATKLSLLLRIRSWIID